MPLADFLWSIMKSLCSKFSWSIILIPTFFVLAFRVIILCLDMSDCIWSKMPIPVSVRITEPEPNRNGFGSGSGFGRKFRFRSFTNMQCIDLLDWSWYIGCNLDTNFFLIFFAKEILLKVRAVRNLKEISVKFDNRKMLCTFSFGCFLTYQNKSKIEPYILSER